MELAPNLAFQKRPPIRVAQPRRAELQELFAAARRQIYPFAICCAVALAFGLLYVMTAVPNYTAYTRLLLDSRQVRAVADVSTLTDATADVSMVDSQVEVLKSESISQGVTEKLGLASNEVFLRDGDSWLTTNRRRLMSWFGLDRLFARAPDEPGPDPNMIAQQTLSASLRVQRLGRSNVLELSYTSPDPARAQQISNTFAEVYLADQLGSKFEAAKRASDWLQDRIQELKTKSIASDLAVQKFKADNNLITAGGSLIGEQQQVELNTQLVAAKAETARAQARFDRLQNILAGGQSEEIVAEALDSPVITSMRNKYLEASKRASEISAKAGEKHYLVINLRKEMEQYQRLIFEELGRIAEGYRSDLEVAQARQKSLEGDLASLAQANVVSNQSQVQLRELERESETYRNLYQNFLQRFQESAQGQSFADSDARIITQASLPTRPSSPNKPLALLITLVAGSLAGVALGAYREFRDLGFRTAAQLRDELDLELLGFVPIVSGGDKKGALSGTRSRSSRRLYRFVLTDPFSVFAETMRSAKVVVDIALGAKKPKIVGVFSVVPGEGKSTISKNLASLIATQGLRCVLVDCDLRNPGLTRDMLNEPRPGLVQVILGNAPLTSAIVRESDSRLDFLPAGTTRPISEANQLVASDAMKQLIATLSEHYDYVIIDLPPLAPVVDARAIASLLDCSLLVAEWGETPRELVGTTLDSETTIREKCIGAILNKVDVKKARKYLAYDSHFADYSQYLSKDV